MRGCARFALALLVVAVGLAGSACGRYGPPVRAGERAAAEGEGSVESRERGLLPPSELPAGADPVAPDPEAP